MEEWKQVPGYEGIYSISSEGRLRRDTGGRGTVEGLILKPRINKDGYVRYALTKDCVQTAHFAHRLVYQAFVGPLIPEMQIDHLNQRKDDNRVENLEQVSRLENMRRSFRAGRDMAKGERNTRSKITEDIVRSVREMLACGHKYTEIGRKYGLTKCHICSIVLRKTWAHVA